MNDANLRERSDELVRKLDHLVSLDDPARGGPYEGAAARACMESMEMAAARIRQLECALRACRQVADKNSMSGSPWKIPNEIAAIVSGAVKG